MKTKMKTCRLRHQGLDETKRVEMEGELANELKEDGRLTFTEFFWKDRVNGDRKGRRSGENVS